MEKERRNAPFSPVQNSNLYWSTIRFRGYGKSSQSLQDTRAAAETRALPEKGTHLSTHCQGHSPSHPHPHPPHAILPRHASPPLPPSLPPRARAHSQGRPAPKTQPSEQSSRSRHLSTWLRWHILLTSPLVMIGVRRGWRRSSSCRCCSRLSAWTMMVLAIQTIVTRSCSCYRSPCTHVAGSSAGA